MALSAEFRDFVADQLVAIGPVAIKSMFGGAGVYADGVMFALIADDELYFKADATTSPDFEAEGSAPFTYEGKSKPIQLGYWKCPERLFEEPDVMAEWAHKALAIARAAQAKKTGGKSRKRQR
ncbi:MAG: TfoX/Sxy family protein [Pseudomonadota bacterium]